MSQLGGFVWSIADQLRGVYKPAQYGTVTLPFVILRRMESVLEAHRDQVNTLVATTPNEQALAAKLRRDLGLHFWNNTTYTLKTLLGDPENLAENLIAYAAGFSSNVSDIFEQFGFDKTVHKLDQHGRLFLITSAFAEKVNLSPDVVSNADMGDLFEHLIYRFNTASNESPGEHFTPRDAIRLMVDLLLHPDSDLLTTAGAVRTVYDPTAGTGGMLSVTEERILAMNPKAKVILAGQELNPESYAVCKSDMIGKGQAVNAIRQGDTLADDLHVGDTFDYCLSNPPYGGDWKASEAKVRAEHVRKNGRFDAGLPRISDGQTLFLQHLVSKMRPATAGQDNSGGRAAIVLNGSPLFTGGAIDETKPAEAAIRRWLITSDLVDCIVALPTNMFYNTGIATYVWILDNNKPAERRGKIQLIDASGFGTKMRKNLGSKNKEISDTDRAKIARIYADFTEGDHSRILEPDDFGYWEITVEQPLQLRFDVDDDNLATVMDTKPVQRMTEHDQNALRSALDSLRGRVFLSRDAFVQALRDATWERKVLLPAAVVKTVWSTIGVHDDTAEVVTDSKGRPEADPALRDTELVPFRDNVDDYFAREVSPHVPGAWIDRSKTKEGYEIPFTRLFYQYEPPRPLDAIDADLNRVTAEIIELLQAVES